MAKIVVSDTTAITHLAKIGRLNLLRWLYSEILIPRAVHSELLNANPRQPGAIQVLNASWIKVVEVKNRNLVNKLERKLDFGESEAIALAIELKSDVLIIDEAMGRSIATQLGKNIIGMIGVLLQAKKAGLIDSIETDLRQLKNTGFRLNQDLFDSALEIAGESKHESKKGK